MKCLLVIIILSITAANTHAAPDALPDAQHVANGCYISAVVYISKSRTGRTEIVTLPSGQQHSVAVLTMDGIDYLRDEFIGVHRIAGDVQRTYSRALKRWLKTATPEQIAQQANEVIPHKLEQRRGEVARAKALLGGGEIVQVGDRVALVWSPSAGVLAAYEPQIGTLVAETKAPSAIAFARAALKAAGLN